MDRLEWIPLPKVRALIADGQIVSSATLVGVMALLLDLTAGTTGHYLHAHLMSVHTERRA